MKQEILCSLLGAAMVLPTAALRQGDFSEVPGGIFDPATTVQNGTAYTRQPFANNLIPRDRWDPVMAKLINAYGSATQYHGLTHPSLPNYYPIIGGTDFGLTYNCATPCIDAETTLVSNIEAAGKTWSGYAQSMPAPGTLKPVGDYSPDQLPFGG